MLPTGDVWELRSGRKDAERYQTVLLCVFAIMRSDITIRTAFLPNRFSRLRAVQ